MLETRIRVGLIHSCTLVFTDICLSISVIIISEITGQMVRMKCQHIKEITHKGIIQTMIERLMILLMWCLNVA